MLTGINDSKDLEHRIHKIIANNFSAVVLSLLFSFTDWIVEYVWLVLRRRDYIEWYERWNQHQMNRQNE